MNFSTLIEPLNLPRVAVDFQVSDLVYDSRNCKENCVFVCLRGASVDGHRFAQMAVEKGAAAIVAEEPLALAVPVLVCENTRKALALLSAQFFGHPAKELTTIGITGTKGKTTTAFMLRSVLACAGEKVGVIGTIGVQIGETLHKTPNTTPESYMVQKYMRDMVNAGCTYCIMEASSIGLKDYRVHGFTFDCGIFTNFSEDHIGGVEHKDMAEYLAAKAMLFRMCRVAAVNVDDENVSGVLAGHTCTLVGYGFGEKADLQGCENHLLSEPGFIGSRLTVRGLIHGSIDIGIPGKFNAYNALGTLACLHSLGVPRQAMEAGLRQVKVKGRVEPVPVPGEYTLLIDYAHNAVSMQSLLTTLREYTPKRLICIFGAGGNRPKARRYEMGEACGRLADLSVITADNSRFEEVADIIADIRIGMDKTAGKFIEIPDRRQAIRYCITHALPGDLIVLAGKGHEDYQEIQGVQYPFDERVIIAEILEGSKENDV